MTGLRVLLVDDNPDDRALVRRELERDFPGADATEVRDTGELERALANGGFDVVITDYRLNWTDGLVVLRRAKERWPDTPVVMFTGSGGEEIAVQAMKDGLDDYVIKTPSHYRRLPSAVASALERARGRAAIREQEHAVAALAESEARFRALFENAHVGICITDRGGVILHTNAAYRDLLGYTGEELRGTTFLDYAHPDDLPENRRLFERGEPYRLEKRYVRKDGRAVWVDLGSAVVGDAEGTPQFAFGIAIDITERKLLEERLLHSQKMEAIGRLVGGIAHDFNNLLTAITGYAELVASRLDENDPVRADVAEIQRAGERAAALVQQLLAFGRKQVLKPRSVNLNAVVGDIQAMLRRVIGEDVELVTVEKPGLAPVNVDVGQLEQVIVNLVVNARDALPRGGSVPLAPGERDVAAREELRVGIPAGRYVTLAVSDTGIGMDADTRARIFEPYFTTKEQGKGSGLGLATVFGIVEQSGGHVTVESVPGDGATFTVYLPRVS